MSPGPGAGNPPFVVTIGVIVATALGVGVGVATVTVCVVPVPPAAPPAAPEIPLPPEVEADATVIAFVHGPTVLTPPLLSVKIAVAV